MTSDAKSVYQASLTEREKWDLILYGESFAVVLPDGTRKRIPPQEVQIERPKK